MIKVWFFIWKYKILKKPINLSYHAREFFLLSFRQQKKVLDDYFERFGDDDGLVYYFDSDEARYYDDLEEKNFFQSYYFDKLLIEYRVDAIRLIDKFGISVDEKDRLVNYCLSLVQSHHLSLTSSELVHYPDDLPLFLSRSLQFMSYLVSLDEVNIKYMTYNEGNVSHQRELIKKAILKAMEKGTSPRKFFKKDGELPKILSSNLDFVLFLIEKDVSYISYLDESLLERQSIGEKKKIIDSIIGVLGKSPDDLALLEKHFALSNLLNQDEDFIIYMLQLDLDFVRYVDWHHLSGNKRNRIVSYIADVLSSSDKKFDVMKYPFREIFFENYSFMNYLINKDFRWFTVSKVSDEDENKKLVDLFLELVSDSNYHFKLKDFLVDGEYLNSYIIDDDRMINFFFKNGVPVVKYIDFFRIKSSKRVVEYILNFISKKDFEFCNDDFLVNGKYPIPLSNNYRFMRYVIDKNFNYLAYIDISMIDSHELKRIVNYAFRMVYFIRGNNKNLNFDIDGYFKDSDIINNEYFQECLDSMF